MPLHLLWDLDGTLTDPREGITRSIIHALESLGVPAPVQDELHWCIGPSLLESFGRLLSAHPEHSPTRALELYRERYSVTGLLENIPYPGISTCLDTLALAGHRQFVATAKPTAFALPILEHFGLAGRFEGIHGAELDGTRSDKAELIAWILSRHGLDPSETVMIGDREHDIIAARKNGLRSIGVTYGYGSREELQAAGASWLADSREEITRLLEAAKKSTFDQKGGRPLG
jgi:phosphoglycolate phosphatase